MLLSPRRFWSLRLTGGSRKRARADARWRNFRRGALVSEVTSASGIQSRKEISLQQHNQFSEDIPGIQSVTIYTYKELKNVTDGFSLANKIGEGGFGSVYKGKLKDGKDVAVKVLSSESKQGAREFLTEITVISGIIHDNLVKLYGCCVEGSHRILVYNYLENNSLAQCLLGSNRNNIHFNWRTRVKISVGVARGLAFLHEEVRPHVVHRDIKASNILLDKDLTPKIADFGLAKLLPANMTHVSTRVAGTIGYLAPEYAIRGQVTRKSDIYSYGVLLLEIVSGRCNTNTNFRLPELLHRASPLSFTSSPSAVHLLHQGRRWSSSPSPPQPPITATAATIFSWAASLLPHRAPPSSRTASEKGFSLR